MKNLNQIIKHTIKKIIKEQDELYVDQPQVKIKGKSGEYETNFETFTAPNGRSILVPEDLKPVVKLYDKQLWLNYVTSTSSLRNHYNKYISANEDIYAKACNDEYLKNLIFEFDKVSKNYIQILDLKGPKYWPSDLNNEEGLQYYYILSKLKYNPNYTIKPSDFKGFGVFGESFLTIGFLFWERFAIAGFGVDAVFFLSPPDFPEVPRLLFEVLIV